MTSIGQRPLSKQSDQNRNAQRSMEKIHEEEEVEHRRTPIHTLRSQLSEPVGYHMDESRVVAPTMFTGKEHFTISYATCISREPLSPGGNLRSPFLFSPSAAGDKGASTFVYPPEMALTRKGLFAAAGHVYLVRFDTRVYPFFGLVEFKEFLLIWLYLSIFVFVCPMPNSFNVNVGFIRLSYTIK
uniref:GRAM domain-containing protein n=1 Tax=Steinernema glaseri TaxID=37863 RepID=A0A1I7YMK8_9BILA